MNFSDFISIYEKHKKSISENKEKYGLECIKKIKNLFFGTLRLNSKDTNEIIRITLSLEVIKYIKTKYLFIILYRSDLEYSNSLTYYYHNLVDEINKIPIENYENDIISPEIEVCI